jgi:FAD:protein FMN transferase
MMSFKRTLKLDNLRSSLILLLFYFLACDSAEKDVQHEWSGLTMGTSYQVKVSGIHIDKDKKQIIAAQIDSALKSVNAQMSTYDPESEISLFNKNLQTGPIKISQPFYQVLETSIDISIQSEGAFDITVGPLVNLWGFGPGKVDKKMPDNADIKNALSTTGFQNLVLSDGEYIRKKIPGIKIDLSAIAKGYGVDVVADLMEKYNFNNYMVEVGGEVKVKGVNASNECWKIGIDKPKHASIPGQQLQGILCLNDVAVATSGDYRNYFFNNGKYYSHTIDPVSGYPVNHNLASVTIITSSCMLADGLATATMVLGPEKGLQWIENMTNVEAMLIERIDENKFDVKYTKGFEKYLFNN